MEKNNEQTVLTQVMQEALWRFTQLTGNYDVMYDHLFQGHDEYYDHPMTGLVLNASRVVPGRASLSRMINVDVYESDSEILGGLKVWGTLGTEREALEAVKVLLWARYDPRLDPWIGETLRAPEAYTCYSAQGDAFVAVTDGLASLRNLFTTNHVEKRKGELELRTLREVVGYMRSRGITEFSDTAVKLKSGEIVGLGDITLVEDKKAGAVGGTYEARVQVPTTKELPLPKRHLGSFLTLVKIFGGKLNAL